MPLNLDINTSDTRMTLRKFWRRPKYRNRLANIIIPHIPWIILIILSVYFYKERLLDESGYNFIQLLRNQFLWVENIGFTKTIAQIIPKILILMELPLKYALIAYTLTPIFFVYTIFIFVYYGLQDQRSGLLILISQTVGVLHGFFVPTFGLYFALPLIIGFASFWKIKERSNYVIVILIVYETLLLLTHPLTFVIFLVFSLYDVKKDKIRSLYEYMPYLAIYVVLLSFFSLLNFLYADNNILLKNACSLKNVLGYMPHIENFKHAIMLAVTTHAELLICSIAGLTVLIIRKEWANFALLASCLILYTLFTKPNIINAQGIISDFWIYPLIIVAFLPLIYYVPKTPQSGITSLFMAFLFVVIGYNLYRIGVFGSELHRRTRQIEFLTDVAHQKGGGKFIVSTNTLPSLLKNTDWILPIESLLIGNENKKTNSVVLISTDDWNNIVSSKKINLTDFIFNRFEIEPTGRLNPAYFQFSPIPYKLLNDSVKNNYKDISNENITIKIHANRYLRALQKTWIWVEITNGDIPIYTGNNNIKLACFWEKEGETTDWNIEETPLQADLIKSLKQYILIKTPSTKGLVNLKIDIICNDNWIGIKSAKEVLVY